MKKIIFLIVILSLLILVGCNKIGDVISEEKYEECLGDKECFAKNMETCNRAIFSECGFGMCNEASIEGEDTWYNNLKSGNCIIRNWQTQNGRVVNYDVTCLTPKWSVDLDQFESEIINSDVGKEVLKLKREQKLKKFSPTDICEHD